MNLKILTLSNFRSFGNKSIEFSPDTNIILGKNGSGKTNILEAIFMISTGKSFRADKTNEVISFDEEITRVKGHVFSPEEDTMLEVVLSTGEVSGIKTPKKRHLVNGVGKRMIDFTAILKTVLFWPEDLDMITGSPSGRRKYLNNVLFQTDREYRRTLISYEKALRRRNKLLQSIREGKAKTRQLIFWDKLLIKAGEYISRKREEYLDFLNSFVPPIDSVKSYSVYYDKSIISGLRLNKYLQKEIASGMTLVGPHRDDIIVKIKNQTSKIQNSENRNLALYGSRGEQRLGMLWLKIGELEYIEKTTQERPMLLLDDIFSEFDHKHRGMVFDMIDNHQTIITTADEHYIKDNRLNKLKLIKLI